MNIKKIICFTLAASLLAGCASEENEHQEHAARQAKLLAQAKVSEADAQAIALAKVPNGTVKEGELEKENGKLIWSFDIATPDTKDITEVNVDAITGAVVGMDKESPESEAKEAKEEKKDKEDKD
ncbi:MAG TPA: PepSY domain-containing protein [Verrucomicrobiae bacterium]|jgi:uncharacterized membrane protein YkoI